jgi:hypothetical protein
MMMASSVMGDDESVMKMYRVKVALMRYQPPCSQREDSIAVLEDLLIRRCYVSCYGMSQTPS